MPRLNNDEQNQAVRMLNAGMSATVVLWHFGCTRKTIQRLWRRFCVTGNVANHPQKGRPFMTTASDDHYIVFQHLLNRFLTAASTGRWNGIHPQTVRNQLRQNLQPTVFQLNSHLTSSNGKAGLVPPSSALPTC